MRLRQFAILMLLVTIFVISACGGSEPEPTAVPPTAAPTVAEATATAAPNSAADSPLNAAGTSPLDAPNSPVSTPVSATSSSAVTASVGTTQTITGDYQPREIPASDAGLTSLAGRVVARFGSSTVYEPIIISAVYLAPVMYEEDGTPAVASLDSQHDPASSTDENGYFTFTNIPPGEYGFVIYYGVTHYLIRDEAGEQVMITVEADQSIDLGELHTDLPDSW